MKKYILLFFASYVVTASAQWNEIPQLKYSNIYCILTTNDSTLFVGGDNMLLMRSTDGGSTWTNVMGQGIEVDTVLSLAEGCGYIFTGANGVESVYRSTDNGETWSTANNGLPPYAAINELITAGSTLYAATDRGIYSSDDSSGHWKIDTAGLSLNQLYPGQNGGTVGIALAGSKLYTIKKSWGSVYTSPTDNISWTQIAADILHEGYAITAIDTNVFIATQQGIYLYDINRSTWLSRNNGLPIDDTIYLVSCILTKIDNLLFAYLESSSLYSYGKGIYVTSNLGLMWTHVNDSIFSNTSISAMVANRKYLFAGTQSGGWRISIADVVTSVHNDRTLMPTGYSLYQNYPNPFNPSTTISFCVPSKSFVTLKVYDIIGREVVTLVDQEISAGFYAQQWNAINVSSGVYFYRLQAGSFTETKKLVLLK
jgi:hypothetical protein